MRVENATKNVNKEPALEPIDPEMISNDSVFIINLLNC